MLNVRPTKGSVDVPMQSQESQGWHWLKPETVLQHVFILEMERALG